MTNIVESYESYREEDRLTTNNARKIEYITTVKAFNNILPKHGRLLDCAAGTGIYSFYFARKGYDVIALDITPRHINFILEKLRKESVNMQARVNNAIDLSDYKDETFDVVLCMGPFYHLTDEKLRVDCINECKRVLKKGGILAIAYINKFYIFPAVALNNHKFLNRELAKTIINTGTILHSDSNCFWTDAYFSTPEEMESLLSNINLELVDHLAVDGISPILYEKIDCMNENEFNVWCEYHDMVCREKSILGISNHNLIFGRK